MKQNILSSFVVFIVAIPLSLGIAMASGAPPATGLIAAAVGGIIVGLFTGAPLMVSGPAAGLSVLVFQIIQDVGFNGLIMATIIGGLFQVALSLMRAGWIFKKFPESILNGMLAAIGLIILLGQIHVLFGQGIPKSPWQAIVGIPASVGMLFEAGEAGLMSVNAFTVGGIALFILFTWPKFTAKFTRLKTIPAALPAVVLSSVFAIPLSVEKIQVTELFSAISANFAQVMAPVGLNWTSIFLAAAGIAIVASAESLLTARATEMMHKTRDEENGSKEPFPEYSLNKELFAQGLGNFSSGVLGGIPITGVIVRSAANVDAGGTNKVSTILHGVWMALFVSMFPAVLNAIPYSALAAVLIMTGIKLLNVGNLVKAIRFEPKEGFLWCFTIAAIVGTNLLTGLATAVGVAGFVYWKNIKASLQQPKSA